MMISLAEAQRYGIDEDYIGELAEIETPIADKWFVEGVNEAGETEPWLRIEVTGCYPRRIGPFDDKYEALLLCPASCAESVRSYPNS